MINRDLGEPAPSTDDGCIDLCAVDVSVDIRRHSHQLADTNLVTDEI